MPPISIYLSYSYRMKSLFLSLLGILYLLTASVVLGETIDRRRLVERNGLVYKSFSPVPYSGKVTGLWLGEVVNGLKFGSWKTYWLNGSVASEGRYGVGGKKVGVWKYFNGNGDLSSKYTYPEKKFD